MPISSDYNLNVKTNTGPVKNLRKETRGLGSDAKRTTPEFSRLGRVLNGLKNTDSDFNRVAFSLSQISQAARNLGAGLQVVFTPFIEGARLAIQATEALASRLISLGRGAETSLTQIGALYGVTGDEARRVFDQLREFARPLPVGTGELVESAVLLQSVNLEPTERNLLAMVNASLALRRPITDVASALQSLNSITLRRLGITLERSGDTARVAFGNTRREVENTSEAIRLAILDIFGDRLGNAVELAAGDLDTSLASLRSVIDDTFITSSRNLLPSITDVVNGVTDWITLTTNWYSRGLTDSRLSLRTELKNWGSIRTCSSISW